MLSLPWDQRRKSYDFVVVGSGYGGAITAARLASAKLNPKPAICILERGREWPVGTFPDTVPAVLAETRRPGKPLGLYEFLTYDDISVIKGSGLGGTSLVNANVAIVPDRDVFEQAGWPRTLTYDDLAPHYTKAFQVLAAGPHPRAKQLGKVQALDRRAQQLGTEAVALQLAVNFAIDGLNEHGVPQTPCIDCGDCVTGCNTGAKNTLYMNYLPIAKNAGAEIFTKTKVEWVEKLADGGWRVHGRYYKNDFDSDPFTLDAKNVVLAASSINTTEILLRSEMHGLRVSPALGTGFSGNGDFFGLAYNGDSQTDVLGYGTRRQAGPGDARPPGPTIVRMVRYNAAAPVAERVAIEDFSFPSAYVLLGKALFGAIRGEDTDIGDEPAELARIGTDRDLTALYAPHGALNHTMLYLVMGMDDARGTMVFDTPWHERDGRVRIEWDKVGQQIIFTRMNEELRRHARALGASFISNPLWNVFNIRHLATAHPIGGCPVGDDYMQGAVDAFGRVFSGDGSVHEGLFVSDGSLVPSALGVNPFMTISAMAEHIVERKIQEVQGHAYPRRAVAVAVGGIDPIAAASYSEGELEKLFRRLPTISIDEILNDDSQPEIDLATGMIRDSSHWKGSFPRGHVLNALSSALFTGFRKQFRKDGLRYTGTASDSDGRIRTALSLREVSLANAEGALEAGEYILVEYEDFPWRGHYDVLKAMNRDLIVGRTYAGRFPEGMRLFTFALTRTHALNRMTAVEHRLLFDAAKAPSKEELAGTWQMDIVSNNNQLAGAVHLNFDLKPDGRLESRYSFMGLMEGLVLGSFLSDHFRIDDFTRFHDEIRKPADGLLLGRYVSPAPQALLSAFGGASLGVLHPEAASGQMALYYVLTRAEKFPKNAFLRPFLEARLPDGVGLTFDEEMVGWYFEGVPKPMPQGTVAASFRVRMTIRDINEFVEGLEHEAALSGTISFAKFESRGPVTYPIDRHKSRFNYLKVNTATGEAEMNYHIEFDVEGTRYLFEGRKFMQRDAGGVQEVLEDYTTLFCRVTEMGSGRELGSAYLKFKTFEDIAAVGSLAAFLRSFSVTGTKDPRLQLQAQMRFLAFTGQFVQGEYDPLSLPARAAAPGTGS
jgi:cholesterol oxidase